MHELLIVDDDVAFARMLEGFLKRQGLECQIARNAREALRAVHKDSFDLVLLDYRLPDDNGMSVLLSMKAKAPELPVVMMTSFADIRTTVKAIRSGARDYITKPINPDELIHIITDALKQTESNTSTGKKEDLFVKGVSLASVRLHEYIQLVAPTDMAVLVQGESGTGKENVARTIHRLSSRKDHAFIAVDCGALSRDLALSQLFGHLRGAFTGAVSDKKGAFELAHGGTLFLDEIGNLDYEVQVKLLRVLQERDFQPLGGTEFKKADVRLICATNEDLLAVVRGRQFREDLYHRLNEFKIVLPALRDREQDLDLFMEHFTRQANVELGKKVHHFSDEVMTIFRSYDWPGNVRELKNVIRRAVLLSPGEVAGVETLPDEMRSGVETHNPAPVNGNLKLAHEHVERKLIVQALLESRYNKSKAAQKLNIDRKTLYTKMARYHIDG